MIFLALDLGSDCGFAVFKNDKFISGTKKLKTYQEKFGARFYEFRKWLLKIIERHDIKVIFSKEFTDIRGRKRLIAMVDLCIRSHLYACNIIFLA